MASAGAVGGGDGEVFEGGGGEVHGAGEDGTLTRMLRDFRCKGIRGYTAGEVLS